MLRLNPKTLEIFKDVAFVKFIFGFFCRTPFFHVLFSLLKIFPFSHVFIFLSFFNFTLSFFFGC